MEVRVSLLDDYQQMQRIRQFEDRCMVLKDQGQIPGSIHLCTGQEAIPVAGCSALRDGDYVAATYRGHGWALARGTDPAALFAELMGRDSSLCGGRAASPYFSDPAHGFLGESSIVGAGVPIACGAALSAQRAGQQAVAAVSIGDGALNQGAVHEALNMAAVLSLPLIMVVENNVYSEMSPIVDMVRINPLSRRAEGYGIPGSTVDGNDVEAVREAMIIAVDRARSGGGPTLIEGLTERLVGHYSGDVQHYRPAGEIARAWEKEPIRRMLDAHPESAAEFDEIDRRVAAEIETAVADALATPLPDPATVKEHLYA
jgi:TPP-dependent pyruvate/acetoin dehydrogenase alpha subunit